MNKGLEKLEKMEILKQAYNKIRGKESSKVKDFISKLSDEDLKKYYDYLEEEYLNREKTQEKERADYEKAKELMKQALRKSRTPTSSAS